ncbi:hypothetical protein B0I27_10697 [Arcticibacter pallidicorallinus]|uniref:Uncharacterized protein n=1 Tax=Arcticibacter pallidicorallinus TaxID=1259464 RepID=A0A2T0U345_9SPHI|nr:hypothetical protein [Arcticibacter pallidicorallinus]PRY52337.1 hypothetical protein B0I27_10697 [Arcticibacter pallidicorallinus]
MSQSFFMVLIDGVPTRFEKGRIIEIEPSGNGGSKIIMDASHEAEEPIIYFTSEAYDDVMKSFLS